MILGRLFIVFLALASFAYAAECETNFVERLNVRVFNDDYIRIGGAVVNVTYQLDRTSGKGYFTASKITSEQGEANFTLINTEGLEEHLDCDIDIVVQFDDYLAIETVTAQAHPNPVDIIIRAHLLTVHVVDEFNRPLEGAEVFIQNRNATTDSNGRARFLVGEGTVSLLVKYDVGKVEETVIVTEPMEYDVGIAFYPFQLHIVDDEGTLLDAQVVIDGEEYLAEGGELEVEKVANAQPSVQVEYENLVKDLEVDLAVQQEYTTVFDLHAPVLGSVEHELLQDQLRLRMNIVDPGVYASGIAPDGIEVTYRYDTDEWLRVRAYTLSQNQYAADISPKPGAAVLFFKIEARDVEGNRGVFEGQLPVPQPEVEEEPEPEEEEEETEEGLPIGLIVVLIVLALLIYIVYRFKLSKGGEE
ncbi:MAG TPA: carboxypeptidase-like regulatory domain-containing protein [Candidatus Bilamarchaeaceae archaeon]|nr:carboxypeptidase-like regulatory domain-containing protein [Candidatus Bilamarchaeaceae archaeon]